MLVVEVEKKPKNPEIARMNPNNMLSFVYSLCSHKSTTVK